MNTSFFARRVLAAVLLVGVLAWVGMHHNGDSTDALRGLFAGIMIGALLVARFKRNAFRSNCSSHRLF